MGHWNDGTCAAMPAAEAGGGEDYYPFTPLCLKGCCPDGASCDMIARNGIADCDGSETAGTTSDYDAAAASLPALAIPNPTTAAEADLCCEPDNTSMDQFCSALGHCDDGVVCV